ncbi:Cupredoxin [Rhizodiscina lignyota]|uniref:Cupredoxin n=1 Tax=Rhizodiscina lignyota TaxID=1504668 RepID=A0A9P4I767_9PEZI|nr:Cupredoxin [Rhizodiscina lignyota]
MVRASSLIYFMALALPAASLPSPASSPAVSRCAAQMDSSLPYYVPEGFHFSGNVRKYYVAAEVDAWDYAPSGYDNYLGVRMNESFRAQTWGYIPSNTSMGTKYDKALYRGYTGADFKTRTEQPPWQGYMGPTIRGEVGDMIEILFVNNMELFYASMHSMGLFYPKEFEGSIYYNGTGTHPSLGDAVAPGECFVYKWLVPGSSASPDPGMNSKLFSYHSYVSMYQDQDAGLSGPIIIYNAGTMESTMAQNREFVLFYGDNQESNSFLALHNVQKYLPQIASSFTNESSTYPKLPSGNESVWYPQLINTPNIPSINTSVAANFFPMNGYIFSNSPAFEMCVNDKVIWYLWDMGFDTHTVHWHGDNVLQHGIVTPSVAINPGQMITVTMNAANPGWWQVICHFNQHLSKGMEANYIVHGGVGNDCTLPPLEK